jgi:hypothetical protein
MRPRNNRWGGSPAEPSQASFGGAHGGEHGGAARSRWGEPRQWSEAAAHRGPADAPFASRGDPSRWRGPPRDESRPETAARGSMHHSGGAAPPTEGWPASSGFPASAWSGQQALQGGTDFPASAWSGQQALQGGTDFLASAQPAPQPVPQALPQRPGDVEDRVLRERMEARISTIAKRVRGTLTSRMKDLRQRELALRRQSSDALAAVEGGSCGSSVAMLRASEGRVERLHHAVIAEVVDVMDG